MFAGKLLFIFQISHCQASVINDNSCWGLAAEGSGHPVPILPGSPSAQVKTDQHFLLLTVLCCLYSVRCLVSGFCKTKFPVQPGIGKKAFPSKEHLTFAPVNGGIWWFIFFFPPMRDPSRWIFAAHFEECHGENIHWWWPFCAVLS